MMLPLLAAVPFFQLSVYDLQLGPWSLPIDPWATLVCIGFVVGLEMARYRAIKLGLEVKDLVDGAVFIVATGFVVAHIVTVVFYFPERLQTDGIWSILRFWEGFASTGGFLGAVLGAWVFYKVIRKRPALRFADVITYGFPFGWFFGRLGCASVHDHVGAPTNFFLGMRFPQGHWAAGVRHELGLYEAIYMLFVMALFWQWGKKDRVPGFFLAWFGILYAPIRFVFDFLRNNDLTNQDMRYASLTPAQYGMIVMFLAAVFFLTRLDQRGYRALRMDGSGLPVEPEPPSDPAEPVADEPEVSTP